MSQRPVDCEIPDLSAQVVIVTGASRGIGKAVAVYLAGCKAKVALLARNTTELEKTDEEIRRIGGTSTVVCVDVVDAMQIDAGFRTVEDNFGPVTLCVNNAGRAHCIGPDWETDADDWWADVEVNLKGTFLCSRAILKRMIPRRFGRIVNISSGAGNMTLPMASSYACSKAAVQRLTDCMAASAKPHGVSVFAISPGPTRTEMTRYILESDAGRKWMPEFQKIPQEKWTSPESIGRFVALIAKGEVDVLSGRFLRVQDDLGALVARADEIAAKDLYSLRLRE